MRQLLFGFLLLFAVCAQAQEEIELVQVNDTTFALKRVQIQYLDSTQANAVLWNTATEYNNRISALYRQIENTKVALDSITNRSDRFSRRTYRNWAKDQFGPSFAGDYRMRINGTMYDDVTINENCRISGTGFGANDRILPLSQTRFFLISELVTGVKEMSLMEVREGNRRIYRAVDTDDRIVVLRK